MCSAYPQLSRDMVLAAGAEGEEEARAVAGGWAGPQRHRRPGARGMLAGRQGARTGTVTAEALPAGGPGRSESPAWAGRAGREPGAGSGGDGYKLQTIRSHRRN